MILTKKQVASFQKLWLSEFKEEISYQKAESYANQLIGLLQLLKGTSK